MRNFQFYRIIYVLLIALMFNLVGYSQDNETKDKPEEEKILKFGLLDEIVVMQPNDPGVLDWDNYPNICLMINDKVYCAGEYSPWYQSIDDEFKPENFKLWVYDIEKDEWKVELETDVICKRNFMSIFNYDNKIMLFGGWVDLDGIEGFQLLKCFNDGYVYDPASKEIKKLPTENAPSPRAYYSTVFNGEELIVFGGVTKDLKILNDGAIFNFKTWKWRKFNSQGVFASLALHKALWLPKNDKWKYSNCMLVWGGTDFIEAIYKKQLDYKDKLGDTFEHKLEIDKFEFTLKGLIAAYYPDEDKWQIIEKMNYDPEDSEYGYRTTHSPGRNGSEIALAGDSIIEFGGKDNSDYWCYQGRRFSLIKGTFEEMSDKNLPPARINHKLIPFKEPNEKGELRNKVLVVFGDMQVFGGCATGWHSRICSVYNIEDDLWEKKYFCPFTIYASANYGYIAYDENRIFNFVSEVKLYDIQNDSNIHRCGNNFNFALKSEFDFRRDIIGCFERKDVNGKKITDYYYMIYDYLGWINVSGFQQIYRLSVPEDYDSTKDKLLFDEVGAKQTAGMPNRYETEKYVVFFDLESIYFTKNDELPMQKTCGYVFNKTTGEIFDVPLHEYPISRISASVVLSGDKLCIVGGKYESPIAYNEYSWENREGRTEEMMKQKYENITYAECAMSIEKRKEMYPDYPYMNDMYIFDLEKKKWSRQVFPEGIKARRYAWVTADNDQILVVGGYRGVEHDKLDPKLLEENENLYRDLPKSEAEYILDNGFVYNLNTNSFNPIENLQKLERSWYYDYSVEESEIPIETTYRIINGSIFEINLYWLHDDEDLPAMLRHYDSTTNEWKAVELPERFFKGDLNLTEAYIDDDELYFNFVENNEKNYVFFKMTKDLKFVRLKGVEDEFMKFDAKFTKGDKNYFNYIEYAKRNLIYCNFTLSKYFFNSEDKSFNTFGYIYDVVTGKFTYIEGYPELELCFELGNRDEYKLGKTLCIVKLNSPDVEVYGDDVDEVYRFYGVVE